MQQPIVLKISGHDLDQPGFIEALADIVAQSSTPTIIVHGGGKEISQMQQLLGITPEYVDGLRVSDEKSLSVAEMVLCGIVNTRIVRTMQLHGVEAQGLNGMDRGLISAKKLHHPKGDLGRVGEAYAARGDILLQLLEQGVTPIIAPICLGDDGAFNVNADHVAGVIAKAVNAQKVVFTTNVQGVLHNGQVIPKLTPTLTEELIADEVIVGGMLPKVHTAQQLVASGVPQVIITNLTGIQQNSGTAIVPENPIISQPILA
jgi:acetylglutamate kinase